MKEPVSVLVMAVGSPLGLSIYKALRASRLPLRLFRADIDDTAAGFYVDTEATNVVLPLVRSAGYEEAVTSFVRENGIDVVFPVIAAEHEFFARHASTFASLGISVVTPDPGLYKLCSDKFRSMQVLREKALSAPATALCHAGPELEAFLRRNRFPLVLKPRTGASSVDVFVVRSRGQMEALAAGLPGNEFVVQEYLSDPFEYTVGVYLSRDRRVRRTIVIRRELKFGLSYKGEVVESEAVSRYCLEVCLALDLCYSTNVQLKLVDGVPCAFEINPRLSSTTSIRAHFGFNEPAMILRELAGSLDEAGPPPTTGRFMRYWEEIFLPNR